MEEKEFPSPQPGGLKTKLSSLYNRSFGVIKLLLGICLLPFVYSVTRAFLNEGSVLEKTTSTYFFSGLISLLALYLFVYEPVTVYTRGQKIL